ncbi:oligosaccharide flippase family protein [Methylophilus methylotrophus]|uniref:oligosaccharide flippase family protein n=1 Tax=Methylophilus methylotrophus TaxID=17 RepID=UPI00037D7A76|nr:oligosaccharide flippase family protein [Methylophilus methylotrophus]
MFKNTIFMGLTTAAKMLSGIVVFVLMARLLGPHDFGLIAYSFTLATLLVLIVDYGFPQQILREIGTTPDKASQIVGEVLGTKILLSLFVLLISIIYLSFFTREFAFVFGFLLLSCLVASFCELLNTVLRAVGHYKKETNIATIGSLIHFFLLLTVLFITQNVLIVAFAFVISRCIFLIVSSKAYSSSIGAITLNFEREQILKTLKVGFPYAADAGFTNFFQQIDTLIVKYFLGFSGVGLYQAATKWLQGGMQFAPVLANVYLPTLANNASRQERNFKYVKMLNIKMLAIGSSGWLFFTFFGANLSELVYGGQFKKITNIWPFVGFLMWVRYVAASSGVILTAYGKQKVRVYTQVVSLIVFFCIVPSLIRSYNLEGMLIAISVTFITIFFIYLSSLVRSRIPTGFNLITILYCIVITAFAIFEMQGSL